MRCATSPRASCRRRAADAAGGRAAAARRLTPSSTRDWLAALKTLDFDTLSRNAQVDYLYIKCTRRDRHRARRQVDPARRRRARPTTAASPGPPRGREGLISDLQRQHDPLHARAAHRARQQGVRVVRERDEEGVARDGLRRRLEEGAREGRSTRGRRRAGSRA